MTRYTSDKWKQKVVLIWEEALIFCVYIILFSHNRYTIHVEHNLIQNRNNVIKEFTKAKCNFIFE